MALNRFLLIGVVCFLQISLALAADLDFSVTVAHPSCTGSSDGEISITPQNGTPDYRVYVFGPDNFYSPEFENTGLPAGEYSIKVEDANDDYIVRYISLNPPVEANITMDDVNPICTDEIVLSANTPDQGYGRWSVISGSGTFSDPYSPTVEVSDIAPGSNIYIWEIYTDHCLTFDEVEVVNNEVTVAYAGSNRTVCSNSTQLHGNMGLGITGHWSVVSGAGTFQDGENDDSDVTVHDLAYGVNEFKWTLNHEGCESSDIVAVNNALPHPVNAGNDQELVGTSHTYMDAEPVIQGEGTWSVISGSGIIADPSNPNTTVNSLLPGENILRWTVVNNYCIGIDDVVVTYHVATSVDSTPKQGQKINLFPNPASDKLYISIEDYGIPNRIEIHSSAGVKVLDTFFGDAESPSIDVSALDAGYYVVSVHLKDDIVSGHFLKR